MESKRYGLDTLALICAGRTETTDERGWVDDIGRAVGRHYSLRDGGLWLVGRNADGAALAELDVRGWQPVRSKAQPALPVPFTACEFAAFTLAGLGVFVIERFEGINDEEDLNETELAALGRYGDDAREVLRESNRLCKEAYRQQRVDDGRDEDRQPRDADAAAAWLLSDAHRAAAVVGMLKAAKVEDGSHDSTPAAEPVPYPKAPPALGALPDDPMQRRRTCLDWFRAEDGKRPGESGKRGKRGALQRVVEKSGIDKDTLGAMLDKAIDEKRNADAFAQLTAKR